LKNFFSPSQMIDQMNSHVSFLLYYPRSPIIGQFS
jgi:hypothetical protein